MRYIYFGKKKTGKHKGITCVGYKLEDDTTLKMSFAFCNPKDRFSRKKAHTILEGRMNNDQVAIKNIDKNFLKYEEATIIARNLLNHITPADVEAASKASGYKKHIAVGGVNIPWWFGGI